MGVDRDQCAGPDRGLEPWRVRIRSPRKTYPSAGILLTTNTVLTCAHAIETASAQVAAEVDFVGRPGARSARARVAQDGWVPERADQTGDVALLILDQPQPSECGAPLRRLPLYWGRPVHMSGYPDILQDGMAVGAALAGSCGPGPGEWVQMNPTSRGEVVRRGFSGAAVVDDQTGFVIGMVVGGYVDQDVAFSYMLPIETIVRYLPQLAVSVGGTTAVDPVFKQRFDPQTPDPDFARSVALWCGRPRTSGPDVKVITTGDPKSPQSAMLGRAIVLADRESRLAALREVGAAAPAGTIPPVGSIDLAIDASGKSVAEVLKRIADRLGTDHLPTDQPITLVVAGIDDSVQPDALVDALRPLAEQGVRLMLAFRRPSSPSLSSARSIPSVPPEGGSAGPAESGQEHLPVPERMAALAARVSDIKAAEHAARRQQEHVATRVKRVAEVPTAEAALRLRLTTLRKADAKADPERFLAELASCERAAERALRRLERVGRSLAEKLRERQALRGSLVAYNARPAAHGLAEDVELARLYRQARDILWQAPCDLTVARSAVDRFQRAVRLRLDDTSGGLGREFL